MQELLRGEKLFLVKSFFSTFCSVLTSSEITETVLRKFTKSNLKVM